ncbi:hypothetical protein BTI_5057 [Burkholderia thailandensis MSMB121]|uniref:DUF2964 family protein n=2 Tax=Burkholderia humptydooensis TaxID=430531 RepID=A0A7U4PBQ6_9BURK|nr:MULTISPECIES: DUF2964 family protein [Burkholderia]AGK51637.1 hypothetical protein BTI_5057 [Burkholderia thailandensis MSMB121]ATF33477.1 DUF2964 domain-containing protein [Burkholderia thailandensis]AJY40564.1 hypothetical protein BW21_4594 [Burkholderia sp. 2002721687]ALX46601.1 hypothetical protein AQ610_30120 [Burkholderia humptydooensis]KST71550.1 hypothetical protein WS76_23675 [Burkholderia humptydooensis]
MMHSDRKAIASTVAVFASQAGLIGAVRGLLVADGSAPYFVLFAIAAGMLGFVDLYCRPIFAPAFARQRVAFADRRRGGTRDAS